MAGSRLGHDPEGARIRQHGVVRGGAARGRCGAGRMEIGAMFTLWPYDRHGEETSYSCRFGQRVGCGGVLW